MNCSEYCPIESWERGNLFEVSEGNDLNRFSKIDNMGINEGKGLRELLFCADMFDRWHYSLVLRENIGEYLSSWSLVLVMVRFLLDHTAFTERSFINGSTERSLLEISCYCFFH
mmetsp:Transcript_27970/g.76010  ORF Transcript_27970/g.76010 Transcript_27970/m.76010 type:complete len:114 (-) Transcript_27970:29-370(-)